VASRPSLIRKIISKYNLRLDRLYTLTTTGQKVILYSLSENATVTVDVLQKFNDPWIEQRRVFGINPRDLEECQWTGEIEDGAAVLKKNGVKEDPVLTLVKE